MPQVEFGNELLEKFCDAGLVSREKLTRVIVDIPFDDIVRIYVEHLGDARTFEILTPSKLIKRAKIVTIEKADGQKDTA